jgi:hypothetical protein
MKSKTTKRTQKQIITMALIAIFFTSCGKANKSKSKDCDDHEGNEGITSLELKKRYFLCSREMYYARCTNVQGTTQRLYLHDLFDRQCYREYKQCLTRRGVR